MKQNWGVWFENKLSGNPASVGAAALLAQVSLNFEIDNSQK
jgi:hypothetical protein